jgi:hypothetical protein
MTPTDIKRPISDRCFYMYLVYQVLYGVSVSRSTLCLMTPHIFLEHILQEEGGCEPRISDAGPEEQGGGTRSDWLGMTREPYTTHSARAVLWGT